MQGAPVTYNSSIKPAHVSRLKRLARWNCRVPKNPVESESNDMQLTPRQLSALVWLGVGTVLMQGAGPLAAALPESQPLLQVVAHALSPVGVAAFVVGLYRLFIKDRKS